MLMENLGKRLKKLKGKIKKTAEDLVGCCIE